MDVFFFFSMVYFIFSWWYNGLEKERMVFNMKKILITVALAALLGIGAFMITENVLIAAILAVVGLGVGFVVANSLLGNEDDYDEDLSLGEKFGDLKKPLLFTLGGAILGAALSLVPPISDMLGGLGGAAVTGLFLGLAFSLVGSKK